MELAATPANQARVRFRTRGHSYEVLEVRGEEQLSLGYYFQVALLGSPVERGPDFIGQSFTLELQGITGAPRILRGRIDEVHEWFEFSDRKRFVFCLKPQSRDLERYGGEVVWIGLDFQGLARTLLHEAGLDGPGGPNASGLRVVYDFRREHKIQPWLLRGQGESSREMLQRRMSREGIFFWVDEWEGLERLYFSDHNASCPYVRGGALRCREEWGPPAPGEPTLVGVHRIGAHHELRPGAAMGYVLPAGGPGRPQASDPRASGRPGLESGFGIDAETPQEAEAWAALRDDYHDCQSHGLHLWSNRTDLQPGYCVTLENGAHAGDYLITAVSHHTAQAAGPGATGATLPYTCEAWVIPRGQAYRGAAPPKREQIAPIEARLISHGPYAGLDAQGRYRVRSLFEPGLLHPLVEGGDEQGPLRALTPYAGPAGRGGKESGFRAPALDGEPVLLACLDDDPDRVLVLGTLPGANRVPPVTGENPTQNRYRTAAGNSLLMEDAESRELVRLHPLDGIPYLELNATAAASWAGLVSEEGAVELSAGGSMELESGGDHREEVGGDRVQEVEGASRTRTRRGKIHHQSGRDIRLEAGDSIHIEAGEDLQIVSGGDFNLTADQDAIFEVRHGDHLIQVNRGAVHIEVHGDIDLEGDGGGPILFEQNGGGLEIDTEGNLRLFGQTLSLDAEGGVRMEGEIHHEVPGEGPIPKAKARPALETVPIEELLDPRTPEENRISEERVALLAVRYAVEPRGEGESLYGYAAPGLARDLPELSRARYRLRRLRPGWLYLVVREQLHVLRIEEDGDLSPGEENAAGLEAAKIGLREAALLLPKGAGTAWLAYSEHPWSESQREKISRDAGGCRHRRMQRFELAAPGRDAFPLGEILDEVADYGAGGDFAWSDCPCNVPHETRDLLNVLNQEAEGGQQAVALHDPIGIGRDLSTLLCHDIAERERHKAEGRHATASAEGALNLIESARPTAEGIAARTKSLYDEAVGRHGGPVGLLKPRSAFEPEARAQLQAEQDALIARLRVKPEDLRRYLDEGRQELKAWQSRIEERGRDACRWLRECPGQQLEHHLEAYDLSDPGSALAYEDAVAGCQGGFTDTREGIELLTQWLLTHPDSSPYWKAIAGGDAELLKELEEANDRAGQLKSGLSTLKTAKKLWSSIESARKAAGEAATSLRANSNTEQLAIGASAVVSVRYRQSGTLDVELERVIRQMRVVAQARMGLLFEEIRGTTQEVEAALWRNFHAERRGANGLRLTPLAQGIREAIRPRVSTASVSVTQGNEVRVWVLATKSNGLVKRAPPSQGSVPLLTKPLNELLPQKPALADAFNLEKLRTYGYAGVTGGLFFFSVVNVVNAEIANAQNPDNPLLKKQRHAAWFAFGSALLSFGDATLDGLHLFAGKPSTGITAKYKAPIILGRISAQMAVKLLSSTLGAAVSFYEASIAGDMAGKLQKAKDPDAARAYFHQRTAHLWAGGLAAGYATATFAAGALAGAEAGTLALGAAAVLAGAAVLLLAASLIAVGVAVYYGVQGEKLTDGPVDVWLDRCWWGRHLGLKELKPYATPEEELQGYFELSYTPQIVADWDDTLSSYGMDDLEITLYLPGYRPGRSACYLRDQINLPMPATLTARPLPEPEPVDRVAGVYRLKLPTLKVKDGSVVVMTFRYFPDEQGLPEQMIEITKFFRDD